MNKWIAAVNYSLNGDHIAKDLQTYQATEHFLIYQYSVVITGSDKVLSFQSHRDDIQFITNSFPRCSTWSVTYHQLSNNLGVVLKTEIKIQCACMIKMGCHIILKGYINGRIGMYTIDSIKSGFTEASHLSHFK